MTYYFFVKPERIVANKYVTTQVAEQMAGNLQQKDNRPVHETLSARKFEIFNLLATGKSVSAIAGQFMPSTSSISTYRPRILSKHAPEKQCGYHILLHTTKIDIIIQ